MRIKKSIAHAQTIDVRHGPLSTCRVELKSTSTIGRVAEFVEMEEDSPGFLHSPRSKSN